LGTELIDHCFPAIPEAPIGRRANQSVCHAIADNCYRVNRTCGELGEYPALAA